MEHEKALIILLVLFSIVLIGTLVMRPDITKTRTGKMMAFLVLFFLPILCGAMGLASEMERSTTTTSLVCRIMGPYGQSLHVDDPTHLAAARAKSSCARRSCLFYVPHQLCDVRNV